MTRTEKATKEVEDLLKQILNGPRFKGHLEGRLKNHNLKASSSKRILKAALAKI